MSTSETINDRMSSTDGIEVREPTANEIALIFGVSVSRPVEFQQLASRNDLPPMFLRILRHANLII